MQWQYRTLLFEFTKDGLLGDKYVDDEEMEKTLNEMGRQGWELVNVALLQDGLLTFLKLPLDTGERVVQPSTIGMDLAEKPSAREPVAAEPPPQRRAVPEEEDDWDFGEERHPQPQPAGKKQEDDFIGGIRIA
jgi:hypothetical protein